MLCAICEREPKKYSCSTCRIPYCSITCYKQHQSSSCTSIETAKFKPPPVPQPLAPRRLPAYVKDRNFSNIVPGFQELAAANPEFMQAAKEIYAKTIRPRQERTFHGRGWTPKKGDDAAMRLIQQIGEGKHGIAKQNGLATFKEINAGKSEEP
ncbi:hypothetical protein EJ04DRAFT_568101 [Polyplosphaeria fusca]|uniref:HIT-type domain-containing protein n=1 Tax=Polyplosphaeria fusca TaxID=682080 RepID=A0A9P4UX61_9PLEO|nr:hypothetical protein EJ04DRAFT_568101 [Polyplosphaeria fusca]